MKILMVASEAVPFSKSGGLGDVVGSLPSALAAEGFEVAVLSPLYASARPHLADARRAYDNLRLWIGQTPVDANLLALDRGKVTWYFADAPALYDRESLYGHPDDGLRFAALCHAALAVMRYLFRPDVLHLHDWQTGLLPALMRRQLRGDPTFYSIRILYTIHNLGYQGIFAPSQIAELGLDRSLFGPDCLEHLGDVNWMKGGIAFSDAISTVSRRYAEEIQTPEHGFQLDPLLRARAASLTGIVNGVDYSEWDPECDEYIPARYSAAQLEGKRKNKRALLEAFGLPESNMKRPLIGIVSRFAAQKGFDLIADAAPDLLREDVALAALGSGEQVYEDVFRNLAALAPERFGVKVAYDNALAHLVEAGSDMFLMPSRYEPCGLNQIYSLRYGTPPIVRATGGLDDTIEEETGFKFREYTGAALMKSVRQAVRAWKDTEKWTGRMRRGMAKDYSWAASARAYGDLYRRILSLG